MDGQPMFRGELGDPPALEEGERVGQDNERIGPLADRVGDSLLERSGFPRLHGLKGDPQRAGRGLHLLHFLGFVRVEGVVEHGHAMDRRHSLLEQLQALGREIRGHAGDARNVAAGARDASHDGFRRIAGDHDDGNRRRRAARSLEPVGARGHQDVGLPPDEFRRQFGQSLKAPLGPLDFQLDGLTLDVPESRSPCRKASTGGDVAADPLARTPTRGTFPADCASAASGASVRLSVRTTASPISRMGASVGTARGV
jgi:hypothetical protein